MKNGGDFTEILSLKNITKDYPGVKALDNVSISFEKGEVHALVGENGAGKSTFIKTISGAIKPTSGSVVIEGKEYSQLEPSQAIELGVAVVYQEMIQMEARTVADNIFAGVKDGLIVDDKARYEKTKALLDKFNSNIDPNAYIRDLSMANRQIVELAKAISKNAKIIIMDEPTASITVAEQQNLYRLVKQLKADGVTVIYISHRLEELFEICDRVSVLRDGQYVTTVNIEDTSKDDLIKYMVGRELSETYPTKEPAKDEVIFEVEHLTGNGVSDISFKLHRGEILGFAGLVGAGRTEIMQMIYGVVPKSSGVIKKYGVEINPHSPREAMHEGIGLIPEDRKYQGCFLDKSILWNISISNLKTLSRHFIMNANKEVEVAESYRSKMKIKAPNLKQKVGGLSGGNQQKVVIAKVLAANPDILIFDEPTRGIDVGARHEIYTLMNELTSMGKSIIMVSSDMEELLGMSERIIVIHEGKFAGEIHKNEYDQQTILKKASGL